MRSQVFQGTEFRLFRFRKSSMYARAVEFYKEVGLLCLALPAEGTTHLTNSLRRSSQSLVLNVSAVRASDEKKLNQKHLLSAKGALTECAVTLDLLLEEMFFEESQLRPLFKVLVELECTLSGSIHSIEKRTPL